MVLLSLRLLILSPWVVLMVSLVGASNGVGILGVVEADFGFQPGFLRFDKCDEFL